MATRQQNQWQNSGDWSSFNQSGRKPRYSSDWWAQQSGEGITFPGTADAPAPKPVYPSNFKSDSTLHDSSPLGAGNHQFYRVAQATEWSRKANLAGRAVEVDQDLSTCSLEIALGRFSARAKCALPVSNCLTDNSVGCLASGFCSRTPDLRL